MCVSLKANTRIRQTCRALHVEMCEKPAAGTDLLGLTAVFCFYEFFYNLFLKKPFRLHRTSGTDGGIFF
jgi:hypothetical protein